MAGATTARTASPEAPAPGYHARVNQPSETPTELPNLAAIVAPAPGLFTVFAVTRQIRRALTRTGKPYFELKLSDRTRTMGAKIWSDALRAMQSAEEILVGTHVKLLFEIENYQGVAQLNVRGIRPVRDDEPGYDAQSLVEEGMHLVEDLLCSTLVFDIETVPGIDLRRAPSSIAQAVTKQAERNEWDHGKVMSLSPYFGRVVSLAVGDGEQDPRTQEVTVFVVPPDGAPLKADKATHWIRPVSEADLLRAFWTLAGQAEVVVSYNGRGFDVPFLIGRSLVHRVPARVDLLSNRYSLRPHLDLCQVLATGRGGTSLDVVCWALGLASPKEEMDGSMVATAYAKGDLASIALYNAGDVRATTAVYQRVRDDLLRYRSDW